MINFGPFITLLGILVTVWLTLYLRNANRVRPAKDAFGVFISKKIGEIPERGVLEFYDNTKADIRSAVSQLGHFLGRSKRAGLERLWKEYNETDRRDLDAKNEGKAKASLVEDLYKRAEPPSQFKSPNQIVRYYLERFHKYSE